ncbi:MAG: MFS transporter [Sneathiella sp.]|uniref:MFS transporter n=1 Tax=Sneathiella sp. TaxID=1964365 RepID=UPI003002C627
MRSAPYYGVTMVGVAFMLSTFAFGGLGSVGVFLKPLSAEFGWSRAQVSFGYTSMALSSALSSIFLGFIADKFGARRLALMGVLAMFVAMVLLSRMQTLWEFYLYYFLFGSLGFSAVGAPLMASVGQWFTDKRGLAIGVVAAGGAFGQGVFPFMARLITSGYGWDTAYLVLGLIFLIMGLPLAWMVRESPSRIAAINNPNDHSAPQDHYPMKPAEVISWLGLAILFCCQCMAVPIVHVVALTSDMGFDPKTAASIFMVLMISGVVGRIAGGGLCDRLGALRTYALMSLGQTVSAVWFPQITNLVGLYGLAVVFGFFYSGVMTSLIVNLQAMTPPRMTGRAMGFGVFFGMIGMGLGGFLGGYIYDLTGNYTAAFAYASAAGVINLCIIFVISLRLKGATAKMAAV